MSKIRVGHGYDVHKTVYNRRMVLGGVEIPCEKGLLGHSDADVLLHAVMDAMLGAAGLGDIGLHFPDTDQAYKDISSLTLLAKTNEIIRGKGFSVSNLDVTVIAQSPKLRPYIESMIENIANVLEIPPTDVNIKATTEEGLGFTGSGDGIAAHAVCLLEK